ncbi:hypothetical protein [Streptomyces spiramenti]|uniref:Secreted protein n=1 Tax=Streptomyces spiramenti TaxID=2720606 RepID=A0ABX1ANH2_9ACTN|nr:hypothetical protein [Streptomyces spiramenti]NJP65892.1 hypothetical protein [Streptomyces spiramenti]
MSSVAVLVGALLLSATPPAVATDGGGGRGDRGGDVRGDRNGNKLKAGVSEAGVGGVVFDPPHSGAGGTLSGRQANWSPPPCYYAPRWSASEFKEWWDGYAKDQAYKTDPDNASAIIDSHDETYGEKSEYEDHNIGREDEGAWWTVHSNPNHPDGSTASCESRIFWVDHDDTPPPHPNSPTPEMLAELAYAEVEIPDVRAELSPAADAQKVNLATWVWMDASDLAPVSVTASISGYSQLWATVTATPSRVELDPGTGDATVHDGCAVGADGGVGRPYTSSDSGTAPACGVTYHRATHDRGPYPFSATVVWEVSWEGSDGSGATLPDGAFGTTQDVTVQEIQTVVR